MVAGPFVVRDQLADGLVRGGHRRWIGCSSATRAISRATAASNRPSRPPKCRITVWTVTRASRAIASSVSSRAGSSQKILVAASRIAARVRSMDWGPADHPI